MNNATYEDFLARLKEERLRLCLSQDDIGRLLRMTQSHYSKAELGSRRFTYYELQCLCDTDVDVFYLFTGHRFKSVNDENMKKKPMGELIFYMNTLCNLISYLDGEDAIALSENDRKKIRYIQSSQIRMGDSRTGLFWLRTVLDYNQFKMAELLGVDIKKLRNLEAGKLLPDSEIIWKISEMFGVPYMLMVRDKKGIISQINEFIGLVDYQTMASMVRSLKYLSGVWNEKIDKEETC